MRWIKRLSLAVAASVAVVTAGFWVVYFEPDPGESAPAVLVSVDRTLFNAVGLNRLTYVRHLRRQGLRPVLVSFPDAGEPIDLEGLFTGIDGLVLTGGGDVAAGRYGGDPSLTIDVDPARDAFEIGLLEIARQRGLPLLGLCRGAQLMNVYRGGSIGDMRDEPETYALHHDAFDRHDVTFTDDSRLARIYGQTTVGEATSWHGQYVERPGDAVRITGRAGDGLPEAIEIDGERFAIGVQWHAEMPPWVDEHEPLFKAYANAVRQTSTK
jgi:gamma-glutamyl-gamma-aminobutyrate hydrolase PuuD